jgi:hypothetical protein
MDSNGLFGIGTTDFNNMGSSSYKGIKVGGSVLQDSGGGDGSATFWGNNAYVGGSNNFYHDAGGKCSGIQMTQGDINFLTFDGGGGVADEQWSPTARMVITDTGTIDIPDNAKFRVGTGNDMSYYHTGTDSYLQNTTGHLYLHNNASSKFIHILQEGASGGITLSTNNTERMRITSDGAVTKAYQPAFCVTLADSNDKGTGTEYQLASGTIKFDRGSDFSSNQFTAPVTGVYQLNLLLRLTDVPANADYITCQIKTNSDNYSQVIEPTTDKDYESLCLSVLAEMTAGHTAHVTFFQGGGSGQTNIDGESFFSGYLVA